MYGYAFGAAVAGVSHVVRRDTMLYPGYVPHAGILPEILHYGSDFAVEPGPASGERLYFNKMTLVDLDLYACADGARGPRRRRRHLARRLLVPQAPAAAARRRRRAALAARPAVHLDGRGAQRRLLRLLPRALRRRRRRSSAGAASRARRAAPPLRRHERRVRQVCAAGRVRLQPMAWMLGECARSCDACGARDRRLVAEALGPAHAYGPLARLPDPRAADGWHAHHGRRATPSGGSASSPPSTAAPSAAPSSACACGTARRCRSFRTRASAPTPRRRRRRRRLRRCAPPLGRRGPRRVWRPAPLPPALGAAPPRRPRLRRARRHAAAGRDRARRARRLLVRPEGAARAGGGARWRRSCTTAARPTRWSPSR